MTKYYPYHIDGDFGHHTVTALQEFLTKSGYDSGPIDGKWGDLSAYGFQRFLKDKGFYNGHIDGKFLQGLGLFGGKHPSIHACQQWLTSIGQEPGPDDGKWGKKTIRALQRALSAHGRYYDDADCESLPAKDRVKWLKENEGMEEDKAQERVMGEFPHVFRFKHGFMCDRHTASARAKWLVEKEGRTEKDARLRVMEEFPSCDFWRPEVDCEDIKASERAAWLESNEGMSAGGAKERVMREFGFVFLAAA